QSKHVLLLQKQVNELQARVKVLEANLRYVPGKGEASAPSVPCLVLTRKVDAPASGGCPKGHAICRCPKLSTPGIDCPAPCPQGHYPCDCPKPVKSCIPGVNPPAK